ncbi:uncharacterized protein LOC118501788 [Phyllostomus discolor]|uniref:Uncharacterized protein LOC118501788 n=1 Tax=Phyllostomus discolor TaxID=89673 RepID=A0A7E6E8A0_9CHIR|nr:uncharacterized protein LOC118501788 [Phyllostomus discolor]
MLWVARALAQVMRPSRLGRAHAPPGLGWAGHEAARALRLAESSATQAEGGGGGKVPVTSGSPGSGRAGRGGAWGRKRPRIGARSPFTPSTKVCGRARRGSAHPQLAAAAPLKPFAPGIPPTPPPPRALEPTVGAVGAGEARVQREEGRIEKNLLLDEIKANTGPSALPPPPCPSRACRRLPGLHGNSFSRLPGRPFAVTRRKSFLSRGRWETKDVGSGRKGPTWPPPDSYPLPSQHNRVWGPGASPGSLVDT